MAVENLPKLAALIQSQQDPLLKKWRAQIRELPSAAHLDTPTLNDHIPDFINELATALFRVVDESIPETLLEATPPEHGRQRYADGFDIVEVVAEYNILRGCVQDLAEANRLAITGRAFHIVNRVFNGALGLAVQTFAAQQSLQIQRKREEYLAFVAHDLRTPLNAISLSARVIEMKLAGSSTDAALAKMLGALHRNVKQLEALVGKILKESDHVRADAGVAVERRELDLWSLVETIFADLHPVAGSTNTTLVNAVPEGLVACADASLLQRVFQNLVSNSIKYTPRGRVEVGAEPGNNGSVACWVRDNGSGIPADRLDKIFDKLETDPDQPGGLGLGLAIVKSYVEAHGGTVTVESAERTGSTFRFVLSGSTSDGR